MASTALSCVLWWRWFGILVMFQGMDRHSGIRTGSQDAARTAGGHSAQDTASRDTERPGESMSAAVLGPAGGVKSKRGVAADGSFSAAGVRAAGSWGRREGPPSPPPLPLSLLLYTAPLLPLLFPHLLLLLLSSKLKDTPLMERPNTRKTFNVCFFIKQAHHPLI